jgi:urease accessory protein
MNHLNPDRSLLRLLQLASPLLPVGGYSYSEGLELLVARGVIHDCETLQDWLVGELTVGSIRLETSALYRAYLAAQGGDIDQIKDWNHWLSAVRETLELRQQSWQMGGSLTKLLIELTPDLSALIDRIGTPCNYAIAFAIAAQHWQIDLDRIIISYLHTWATNLISGGIKLIPLGQTAGQQILWDLQSTLDRTAHQIPHLTEDDLYSCSWGLSLASMQHETLYSRLFRS